MASNRNDSSTRRSGRERRSSEDEDDSIDLAELLPRIRFRAQLVLASKWWVLVLTCLAGVAIQGLQTMQQQPTYTSTAQLILEGQVNVPEANAYREQMAMFFDTQTDVMMSRDVRENARDRVSAMHPDLKPSPVRVQAMQKPRKAIFLLTATGAEPKYTQAYLDATLDAYIAKRKQSRSESSESTLIKVQDQILKLERQIEQGENEIVEFQKSNNLVFMQEQGATAGQHLSQLKTSLADLKTQYQLLETARPGRFLLEDGTTGDGDSTTLNALGPDEKYLAAKERLLELEAEKREFSIYMKPKHPKIIQLTEEIERNRNVLRIYQDQNMQQIADEKAVVAQRIENLEKVIKNWESTALDLSRKLAEYSRLESRLQRNRDLYDRLLNSIQSIDLDMNVDNELITVYERATPPRENLSSAPKQMLAGAAMGLGFGLMLMVVFALTESRITAAEDIQSKFDEPVLGTIPKEKPDRTGRLPLLEVADERHLFSEGCRSLRSSLLFNHQGDSPRLIMISSSVPGEGKSTVACNLALAIALSQTKVLLIDADLRRGTIHKNFSMPQENGLSEHLEGKLSRDSALRSTNSTYLDVITAGDFPDQPGELLMHPRMEALLSWAREKYDIIICDTAPILASDDTTNLANQVDTIVMVVRVLYTQSRHIKLCHERLGPMVDKLMGYVCNFADIRGQDYYYYNRYTKKYYNTPKSSKRKAQEKVGT